MSVSVSIPSAFRRHTEGQERFDCAATNVDELLEALGSRFPQLKPHLRDEQGQLRRFLNIYVNDEDIRFLEKNYKFAEGDQIILVPSIAGG
ncbi:MAG TPA: MoaD/ThiS family protein [Candidatus Angelobacter sp.]|nr:MoaD/ThiS family protein [Candidatus Angelobacter sp.]